MRNTIEILLATLCTFLAPIHSVMLALLFFIFVDLISGVFASYKNGVKITSNRLKDTIIKTIVYMTLIILGYVIDTIFLKDIPGFSGKLFFNIFSAYLGIVEFKSCIENLDNILGTSFMQIIKNIFKRNDNTKDLI